MRLAFAARRTCGMNTPVRRLSCRNMRSLLGFLTIVVLAWPAAAVDLDGCVYTLDGSKVADFQVTARIAGQPVLGTATGSDGCFRLTALPDAMLELSVQAGPLSNTLLVLPDPEPLTITVMPERHEEHRDEWRRPVAPRPGDRTLGGTVTIDGRPLAGAPLLVHTYSDEMVSPIRTVTDAKGRYALKGLAPAQYAVTPDEGWPRLRRSDPDRVEEPPAVDLRDAGSATIDLAFTRPPRVSGRVLDADGKPVGGARVQTVVNARPTIEFATEPIARTAENGRFSLAAPPFSSTDEAVLAVTLPGHSTVRSKPFVLRDAPVSIDVRLPRFETVTLRVIGAGKTPLEGARVAFARSDDTAAMRDPSFLLMPPYDLDAQTTNADGVVTLHVEPASYDFAVDAKEHQVRTVAGRAIPRSTTIDIELDPAFSIRGRVHRAGSGVAGVTVGIERDRTRGRGTSAITDEKGFFEIGGLARGTYRIAIAKFEELVDEIVEAKAPSVIDVPLAPAGSIAGRVIDAATGSPVTPFAFSIEPLVQNERASRRGTASLQRGSDSAEGTFTATIPAGGYRVTARAAGYVTPEPIEVRVEARTTAAVELALGRGLAMTGRVTDETGAPLDGVDVVAISRETERERANPALRIPPGQARTGADGLFTITGLREGQTSLHARKEGYVPFRDSIALDPNAVPIDIRLSRGLTLEGVVTRGGRPVEGAQIGATTPAIGGEHQPATSDSNGRFVLRGLIPARYTVSAYKDDAHTEVRDVDPSKQKQIALSLDRKSGGVVFGSVSGLPASLPGRVIRRSVFVASEERGAEGTIDEAGNYRIEDVPAGTLFVSAHVETSAGGRSSLRKQVTIASGEAVRVDLDLGGTVRVSGRVLHEGEPVSGARVVFSSGDGVVATAVAAESGAYEIVLPTPGRYQIFAHAEHVMDRQFSSARDIRGGEIVDIEFREQVIEGVVLDASTRQPIGGAVVSLTSAVAATPALGGESRTDPSGRFRIVTAASGAHRLIASAAGHAHGVATVMLGGSPVEALTFELAPAADLRVRVVDGRTTTPLEAHLVLSDSAGNFLPVRAVRSDDGSGYVFSVAPGRYRVNAIVYGYDHRTVEATAPGQVEITVE